jgi:hypothetical protein
MTDRDDDFRAWIDVLREDVVQDEFGYEPGEFTIYLEHWRPLFDEGLTPREAWLRALDDYGEVTREEDAAKAANYARIVAADEALTPPVAGRG